MRISWLVVGSVVAVGCGLDSSERAAASVTQGLSSSHCPPNVPAALAPAADQSLWRVFFAEGVQIYRCTATATGAAWVFDAPDALLYRQEADDEGDQPIVGHHFAGPTWEYKDHSSVVGARVAAAPAPVAGAIPWLLLTAASHSGTGKFSEVTTIQRMDTVGGVAPSSGCDATTVGAVARVPYTANYYMYRTRSGGSANEQCR